MASQWLALNQDPRWIDFCKRYSGNPTKFVTEVLRLKPTKQQITLYNSVAPSRSRTSVSSGHGCFGIDTPIMLADGRVKRVQDISVNDQLMGDDGKSLRNVLELKRGTEQMYRFTYADGTSHVFNESHILCLVATNSKGRRKTGDKITVTVREWLTWGYDKKRCHAIYRSAVTEFKDSQDNLPIDPYILGLWLGDGESKSPRIFSEDIEVVEAWRDYAEKLNCRFVEHKSESSGNAGCYSITKAGRTNPFYRALDDLGLIKNKHIPPCYLTASYESRCQLLAGLIDTDGSLDRCSYDFIQKNRVISEQVCWLARSIGCHATMREVTKTCVNNGVKGAYYRVTIGRNTDFIPVRIERKKRPNLPHQRRNLNFSIKQVEPLGIGEYYGFILDGNSQFLGGDFTVLHNTGKTSGTSHLVLWHLLCYRYSVTLITANDMDQMKATVWKEIATNVERIRSHKEYGWIAEHIELLANGTMRIKGFTKTWFVESKTANAKTANKLAGRHGEWLFIIADEASTIPDEVLTTIRGALTGEHNRMLMNSQPTRNAGFFWRTHHELSMTNGGDWNNLVFDSFDSILVSDDALQEMWHSYDNDERRVRLLGLFPQDSSKHMMSLQVAMKLYTRGRIIRDDEAYGYFITSDIASGEGLRDKSAVTIIRVIGYGDIGADARRIEVLKIPIHTNSIRSNKFANTIMGVSHEVQTPLTIVDSGGLGINVCQDLEDASVNVHRVNWGNPCFQNKNKDRYLNLRAQAMHQCARACKEGRVSILTPEFKKDIIAQSSRIPKTFSDKGRIRVPPKHSAEWEGMKSPDLWDAICFAFLEGTAYTAVEHTGGTSGLTVAQRLEQEAEDLLGDIE